MAKDDILLIETKDRKLAFAVYDECRKTGGAYVGIEMKVMGDTNRVYIVPFHPVDDLQPGPRMSFDESVTKLKGVVQGFKAAWAARS
jgi:hypothetical protein